MKRALSVFLVLTVFLAVFSSFGTVIAEDEKTVITYTNPVITADVGETVDLSDFVVQFEESGDAAAAEWYSASDNSAVSVINGTEKGVERYIAKNGGKEMTVYFVCKEADETEYVLYEADFSKYSSIDELKADGFVTNAGDEYYKFEDGTLVMGGIGHDYVRLMLPEWLGDFGDYSISADIKMLETKDTSRWFGLVYRIQNVNGSYYPYYHMCVRENTTASSGIEFAERTSANGWNVASTTSGPTDSLKKDYNTVSVKAFEQNIQYNFNGEEELFVTKAVLGVKTENYTKGLVGITMNFGTVSVKNVKVTVQQSVPERPKKTLNLINNAHEENNLINPIANVERLETETAMDVLSGENPSGIILIRASEFDDLKPIIAKCIEKQVIPTVWLESQDDVSKLNNAMNVSGLKDANAISADAKLLTNIRTNKPVVRTGLIVDIPENFDSVAADVLRREIRSAPATFCVIKSEDASYSVVDELQELAVAVWVDVSADEGSEEYTVQALRAVTSGANGIITNSASKLTETINGYLEENAMTRTPVMIGHRGNPSQAPENSLSGFITAYENGADVFEVDVEITKDGEIIIMHDSTINRTTNYTGSATVNQMTLEEIKKYNLKALDGSVSDEKVPTLREVLEEFKDKDCKIFVEFKGSNADNIKTTCDLIKEFGMEHKVDVISFSTGFLSQTQNNISGMSTGYLHSPSGSGSTVEDALETLYPSIVTAQNFKSTVNPSNGIATSDYMQAATDRGITVWPWTYSASSNNSGFLSGCDGVTTDDMQWVTNMAKYLSVSDITVLEGGTADIDVKAVTYGGKESKISDSRLIVQVISGGEFISVEDGTVNGIKQGVATVMFGFKTKTAANSEYVLYTQPVTVTVSVPDAEAPAGSDGGINANTVVIIVSAAVILVAAIAAVLLLKKKK